MKAGAGRSWIQELVDSAVRDSAVSVSKADAASFRTYDQSARISPSGRKRRTTTGPIGIQAAQELVDQLFSEALHEDGKPLGDSYIRGLRKGRKRVAADRGWQMGAALRAFGSWHSGLLGLSASGYPWHAWAIIGLALEANAGNDTFVDSVKHFVRWFSSARIAVAHHDYTEEVLANMGGLSQGVIREISIPGRERLSLSDESHEQFCLAKRSWFEEPDIYRLPGLWRAVMMVSVLEYGDEVALVEDWFSKPRATGSDLNLFAPTD